MTFTLAERAARTSAVIERFRNKPFDWNGANCIKLAAAQAKAMGHKVPPVPQFRSALGAKKALAQRKADSVSALLDQHFARHAAPAFALLGDLVVLQGEEDGAGLEAVCIADGRGNVFGWHGSDPSKLQAIKFVAADVKAAWRLGE